MTYYQSHQAHGGHGHAAEYYHSDPTAHHSTSHSSSHKKSKYTPKKLEEDLHSTIGFLVKALQKEFLKSTGGSSSGGAEPEYAYPGVHSGRAGPSGPEFQEILVKGKKKLEKLIKKYKEVAGATATPSHPGSSHNHRHRSSSAPHAEYDSYGPRYGNSSPPYGAPGHVHTPDDIEEVESVRSSRRSRSHNPTPRAPSPPYTGPYGRTVYDEAENPDYHRSSSSGPYGSSNALRKNKNSPFSLDNINLPLLIERAAVVLGIIEKVLVMKAGGSSSGHHSSSRSGAQSGSGGGLVTAVKVVRMILALSEGAGLGSGSGRGRTHH